MTDKEFEEMQDFLDGMIDFPNPSKESEEKIASWAMDKWSVMMEREYWREEYSTPFIQLFTRYMRPYVGEVFKSGKSD